MRTSAIPRFRPSPQWWADWPHEHETLVGTTARLAGSGADEAVSLFLTPMTPSPAPARPGEESWYHQGYSATVRRPGPGLWEVRVESAGQDGQDSLLAGAADLHDAAVRAAAAHPASAGDGLVLTWQECPARHA